MLKNVKAVVEVAIEYTAQDDGRVSESEIIDRLRGDLRIANRGTRVNDAVVLRWVAQGGE